MAPGIGFGEHGDDFVRIALVENEQRIRQAARNIRRFLERRRNSCTTSFRLLRVADNGQARFMAQARAHDPEKCGTGFRIRSCATHRLKSASPVWARSVLPWSAQIGRQREALTARCGRAIEVVAVCARSRAKDRGIDLGR